MKEVKILGVGSFAPEKVMTNDDLAKIVDTNDEWITSRTGIKERRISEGENSSDLGAKAAMKALATAKLSPMDIDMIIVATSSPDALTPSTACFIQAKIGAEKAFCFDVSAGCSGFVYALSVGEQFIKTGQCKNALIIGAEVLSKVVDWKDRNTCVLFGDGAGAVVLGVSEERGIIASFSGAQGSKADALGINLAPVRNPYVEVKEIEDTKITMDGREVFRFATSVVQESIENILKSTGHSIEEIKYIVPHQANYRIIDYAAKKLGVSEDKFYMNLQSYGNTSAASIPLALDEMQDKGLLNKGDKIILVAFGAGLTWAAALIEWSI